MGFRIREGIKSVIIWLLLLSAVLLALTAVYYSGPAETVEALDAAVRWVRGSDSQPPRLAQARTLTDASQPLTITLRGEAGRASVHGDFAALDTAFGALGSYLAEALDTAGAPVALTAERFRQDAAGLGVSFRYPGDVPLTVLAAWLDAEQGPALSAAHLFLRLDGEAVRLLATGEDGFWAMDTLVDAAALGQTLAAWPADGTELACESETDACRRLDALTLIDHNLTAIPEAAAVNPCGDAFRTAAAAVLGFNPYDDSSYQDNEGAKVYVEAACSLRVSADGVLTLRNPGRAARFSAAGGGDGERIEYVRALIEALAGGVMGDGRLLFSGLEGDTVEFSYALAGRAVRHAAGPAVTARFDGAVLSELRFRVRTYSLDAARTIALLPAAQAAAALPEGAALTLAYADAGEETLRAGWLR